MNNLIKIGAAAVLVGAVGLTAASPATAAPWWNHNHRHYNNYPHYYGGYYRGGYGYGYYPGYYYDPGAAIATGIIGGIAGAIVHEAVRGGGSSHVARCEANYRSYQRSSNTYMGYDGVRHICRL